MFFLEVDPSTIKPGWTPLIITILLAAAIVLLMISMRRQIRKIRAPHRDEVDDSGAGRPDGRDSGRAGDPGSDLGSDDSAESDRSSAPDAGSRPDRTTLDGTAGERHPIGHG